MLLIEGVSINMSMLIKSPTIIVGQFVGIRSIVVSKIEMK